MLVVSGLTGAGKSTLGKILAEILGTAPVRTSDFLVNELGIDMSKTARMQVWDDRVSVEPTSHELNAGIVADRQHLAQVLADPTGVHESIALPLLLDRTFPACRILLMASATLRVARVARARNFAKDAARRIVTRKDAQTLAFMRTAYNVDMEGQEYAGYFNIIVRQEPNVRIHTTDNVPPGQLAIVRQALQVVTGG